MRPVLWLAAGLILGAALTAAGQQPAPVTPCDAQLQLVEDSRRNAERAAGAVWAQLKAAEAELAKLREKK
jgi:hypothetical protein